MKATRASASLVGEDIDFAVQDHLLDEIEAKLITQILEENGEKLNSASQE